MSYKVQNGDRPVRRGSTESVPDVVQRLLQTRQDVTGSLLAKRANIHEKFLPI
jgi:hypothetical protein